MEGNIASPVGRGMEVGEVEGGLRSAADGGAAVVVLTGGAGIGKTTVVDHAIAYAQAQGFAVLSTRPAASDRELAFAGLIDLLSSLDGSALASLPEPQRDALETALWRKGAAAASTPPVHALGAGVLGIVRQQASVQPVLVVVDDAQWLDHDSGRVLSFVARRLTDERICVLLAVRAGETTPFADLVRGRRVRHVLLGPLSIAALHHLLVERLETQLPRPDLVRLHELVRGNPLFALEAAKVLPRGARPSIEALPTNLEPLLAQRLQALGHKALALVLTAAVAARPTVGLLMAANGGAAEAELALAEAERAGVLAERDGAVNFVHPLLAATALATLSPADRRLLHKRLAEVVDTPEEEATHRAAAAVARDSTVADLLESVAASDVARGALDAAAERYERAAALTPLDATDAQWRRLLAAADANRVIGDLDRALPLASSVLNQAPPGELRARAGASTGVTLANLGRSAEGSATILSVIDDPGLSDEFRARRLLTAVRSRQLRDLVAGASIADQALALAQRSGDPALLAVAERTAEAARFMLGGDEHSQLSTSAAAMGDSDLSDLAITRQSRYRSMEILVWSDRFAESEPIARNALRGSIEAGDIGAQISASYFLAETYFRTGRLRAAYDVACDGVAAMVGTANILDVMFLHACAAAFAAHLGHPAAKEHVDIAAAAIGKSDILANEVPIRAVAGLVALLDGDLTGALANLEEAHRVGKQIGLGDPGCTLYHGDLIEALVAVGRTEDALIVVSELESTGRRLNRSRALAVASRGRRLVAGGDGDIEAASAALQESLQHHEGVADPFERARTLLAVGAAERRARRKQVAREAFEEAKAVFDHAGALPWSARAESELSRTGGRVASPTELSSTEERVAELVAAGRSNGEVATALFVSVRTVESHLTRIYRKLNVRTRTELAAQLKSAGFPDSSSG